MSKNLKNIYITCVLYTHTMYATQASSSSLSEDLLRFFSISLTKAAAAAASMYLYGRPFFWLLACPRLFSLSLSYNSASMEARGEKRSKLLARKAVDSSQKSCCSTLGLAFYTQAPEFLRDLFFIQVYYCVFVVCYLCNYSSYGDEKLLTRVHYYCIVIKHRFYCRTHGVIEFIIDDQSIYSSGNNVCVCIQSTRALLYIFKVYIATVTLEHAFSKAKLISYCRGSCSSEKEHTMSPRERERELICPFRELDTALICSFPLCQRVRERLYYTRLGRRRVILLIRSRQFL